MLIQVLLLSGIVALGAVLLRRSGARHQAVRRLALLAFAAFAATSVVFPDIWNTFAELTGVGRGTDLLLYCTIMVLLGFITTSYIRFRELESRFTKLARRIALDEVPPAGALATGHRELPGAPPHPADPREQSAERGRVPRRTRVRGASPARPGAGDHVA